MARVNKEDKDKLLIVGVLIALVAYIAVCYTGTRYVPLYYIGIAVAVIEVLFLMPYICKNYYWVKGYEVHCWMIPFVNVIQCFPAWNAIASVVTAVGAVLSFSLLKLPAPIIRLLGEDFVFAVGGNNIVWGMLFIHLLSVLLGIGYSGILRDINFMIYEATGGKSSRWELFYYALLFFPVIRACGLVSIAMSLSRLKLMGYYEGVLDNVEYEEEEEYDE